MIHDHIIVIVAGIADESVHKQYRDDIEDTYYQLTDAIQDHIQRARNLTT